MKQPYRIGISAANIAEHRRTWHIEVDRTVTALFKVKPCRHVQNAKRRPCVQKRLNKLGKYVRRAWNGYSFGELKRK